MKEELLKEDWVECTLGEVFNFVGGGTPSKSVPDYWNGNIPWASIKDIKGNNLISTQDFITEKGLKNSSANIANVNEIILATRISHGTPILSKIKTAINQDLKVVKPKIQSEINYFFWLFNTLKPEILKLSSGTTVLGINLTNLKSIQFLLPPLPIQQAIVKKIEQLFSSLDSGIADLKKAQAQLKIYRQAVLKKAFDLNSKKYKIEEVCKDIFAGGDKPQNFYSKTKTKELAIPILANAVANNGLYGYTKTARVNETAITIAGRGSGTGHVELRKEPFFPIVRLITIIPNFDKVDVKYFMYFLKNLNIKGSGSAIPQLTIPTVKGFEIHLPPIQEQTEIVHQIESRLSVCDKVEQSITESLEKAKALRQSILKKAFEGKLLSTAEIAACKEDAAYEPASVLLKRIKNERLGITNAVKKTKIKKKKITKIRSERSRNKKPPVPAKISTDIQAGVIAKVIQLHRDNPKHLENLTHIKCEKISHLVEYHLQIPLGRIPVKDSAGPDDYNHLKKVEHRANMAGYFTILKKDGELGYSYKSGRNITKAIDNLEKKISTEQKEQMDNLIKLFLKFDLESAEIIATVYAGWNNLLIDGKTPTDDEIVLESKDNWSKRKEGLKRERFYKALQWMRKEDIALIPIGFGAKVLKKGG